MSNSLIYVGIDVDDNSFHFSAFFPTTGEMLEQKTRPTLKSLVSKFEEIKNKFPDQPLKICYEATYLGYSLQRDLTKNNFDYVVIAPSSIPLVNGNQIKTDRIDVGIVTALVFLAMNDYELNVSEDELEKFVLGVASGNLSKPDVVKYFRKNSQVLF